MLARLRKATEENEGGFTLIELLVVMIIIGILAAIAIPTFLSQRNRGYDAQAKSDARNIASLMETNFTDTNLYTAYTTTALLTAGLTDFKKSQNTTSAITKIVDSAGAATAAATGTTGFCVLTTSTSGKTFAYNSNMGGLTSTATC